MRISLTSKPVLLQPSPELQQHGAITNCPPSSSVYVSCWQVEEHNATREQLAADVADTTAVVKAMVVKAEDARLLTDMKALKRYYRQLYDLNR